MSSEVFEFEVTRLGDRGDASSRLACLGMAGVWASLPAVWHAFEAFAAASDDERVEAAESSSGRPPRSGTGSL